MILSGNVPKVWKKDLFEYLRGKRAQVPNWAKFPGGCRPDFVFQESCLNTNQKEFLGCLPYLLTYTY